MPRHATFTRDDTEGLLSTTLSALTPSPLNGSLSARKGTPRPINQPIEVAPVLYVLGRGLQFVIQWTPAQRCIGKGFASASPNPLSYVLRCESPI